MRLKNFEMFEKLVESRLFTGLENADESIIKPFTVTICGVTAEIPCMADYYEILMGALEKISEEEKING